MKRKENKINIESSRDELADKIRQRGKGRKTNKQNKEKNTKRLQTEIQQRKQSRYEFKSISNRAS